MEEVNTGKRGSDTYGTSETLLKVSEQFICILRHGFFMLVITYIYGYDIWFYEHLTPGKLDHNLKTKSDQNLTTEENVWGYYYCISWDLPK